MGEFDAKIVPASDICACMARKNPSSTAPFRAADNEIIYGLHAVRAALANRRRRIFAVMATANGLARLEEAAPLGDTPVDKVDAKTISRVCGEGAVHQGVAIAASPLPAVSLDQAIASPGPLIVLDRISDPHNVGAIVRLAAAFSAAAVITTERGSPRHSGLIAKAASGGVEHVPVVRVVNLARALTDIDGAGIVTVGLDSQAPERLEEITGEGRFAIVVGAEGKGLRRLTRERCAHLARIDLPGAITSLNVSNATALALYALTRPQLLQKGGDQ